MTRFQFAPLLSDYLVYGLLLAGAALLIWTLRSAQRRGPLIRILRTPSAAAAVVVLGAYLALGVLDSVHLRARLSDATTSGAAAYAPEAVSLLDIALAPLRDATETSYSAPFALYAFSREARFDAEGTARWVYPRLEYGGAHLDGPGQRTPDILRRLGLGVALGLALFMPIAGGIWLLLARHWRVGPAAAARRVLRGEADIAWRTLLATGAALAMCAGCLALLAAGYHVFGTDKVGQDVLYLALKSVRTGLLIGVLTTVALLPIALLLGIAAGYYGRRIDDLIQYLYTTLASIPGVLLIAAAVLTLQVYMDRNADAYTSVAERADVRLVFLCMILGVTGWISLCRLLRAETLKLREIDYVTAARCFGVPDRRILARHILPNTLHIVTITLALDFSGYVLAEAVLSYVGVGVDPSMISWGNMINTARLELAREPVVWWSLTAAFVLMFGLVLSANLLADAVRDAYDPRLRGVL